MFRLKKLINKKLESFHFLPFIGAVFVLFVHTIGINKMKVPTILFDEAGYWASAAHFAGKDWHGITSVMSYFSYGVGLFLSIFMRLGNTPVITYHMVMVCNAILVVLYYFFTYRICQYIFPMMERIYRVMICVACMMYSTFIMNSQMAWSEHYLAFLFGLEIYLLMNILKKPCFMNCGLYMLSVCYSYMVHQRTIVVLLVSVVIILDLIYLKKISCKQVIWMTIIFAIMMVIHFYIKNDIQYNVWNALDEQAHAVKENDYSGRVEILFFCIKSEGIKTIFRSFVGKIFYLMIATAGICIFAFKDFIDKGISLLKGKYLDDRERLTIYIFLLFTAIMLFNVLSNLEDGISTALYSMLVYGRYMEWAVPIILLVGLGNLISNKYSFSAFFKIGALLFGVTVCVYFFYHTDNFEKWTTSCVGGITWFYDHIGDEKRKYVLLAAQMIFLLLLCVMLLIHRQRVCAILIIALYWGLTGFYLREEMVYYIQSNNQRLISTADRILDVDENIPIYFVIKDGSEPDVSLLTLQYLLEDYKLFYIHESDMAEISEPYYLLVADYSYEAYQDYVVVEHSNPVLRLLVSKDNEYLIQKFVEE